MPPPELESGTGWGSQRSVNTKKLLYFGTAVRTKRKVSGRKGNMKILLIVLLSIGTANAIPITVNLGPPILQTTQTGPSSFDELNGTPLAGQTLSLDFSFVEDQFVRISKTTSSKLDVDLALHTNGSSLLGFLDGTGYLTNINGKPIPGFGITGSASSDAGDLFIGLFPLVKDDNGTPNTNLHRPFDFYDVHFDITLPDNPSFFITGADLTLFSGSNQPIQGFGIGPFVPDSGNTALLFGLAAVVVLAQRAASSTKSSSIGSP
jgi:hypothetical protein